jgi:hypothetical protein
MIKSRICVVGAMLVTLSFASTQSFGQQSASASVRKGLPKGIESLAGEAKFSRPGRDDIRLETGSKIPYATSRDSEFLVEGKLVLEGTWKLPKELEGIEEIDFHIRLTASPVFCIRDEAILAKLKRDQCIDWAYWKIDAVEPAKDEKNIDNKKLEKQRLFEQELAIRKTEAEKKASSQGFDVVVKFRIPPKDGPFKMEIPFDVTWKPNQDWLPDYYYAISVSEPKGFKTTRAGVFQVTRSTVDIERESRVIAYRILQVLGFQPDPFTWLR